MTTARESLLKQVREAVAAGNRAGAVPALEPRGTIGYQGAGPDPVQRFHDQLIAAGGQPHIVPDQPSAVAKIIDLVRGSSARKVLLGCGPCLDNLDLTTALGNIGAEVTTVDALNPNNCREPFFAADLGISAAEYLIGETGTVVQVARLHDPRSLSLLPPIHIAVAHRRQVLPDLFDLFAAYRDNGTLPTLPSCLSLITGPSKTGDIELRLVTGVHGPGEVHVVLINDSN